MPQRVPRAIVDVVNPRIGTVPAPCVVRRRPKLPSAAWAAVPATLAALLGVEASLCAAGVASGADVARRATMAGEAALALSEAERARVYEETLHLLGGNANVVSKWRGEIRFAVLAEERVGTRREAGTSATAGSGTVRDVAKATIGEIARVASLPLRLVEPEATAPDPYLVAAQASSRYRLDVCEGALCANFLVLVAPVETMRALAEAVPLRPVYRRALAREGDVYCFFAPFQNGRREIVRAFVYVQSDLPRALLETCLREEMHQSFGLFNDVSGSAFFSFDNRIEPKAITAFDRLLLASLYASEVRAGAPVFAVAERFMRALDAQAGSGGRGAASD